MESSGGGRTAPRVLAAFLGAFTLLSLAMTLVPVGAGGNVVALVPGGFAALGALALAHVVRGGADRPMRGWSGVAAGALFSIPWIVAAAWLATHPWPERGRWIVFTVAFGLIALVVAAAVVVSAVRGARGDVE